MEEPDPKASSTPPPAALGEATDGEGTSRVIPKQVNRHSQDLNKEATIKATKV